MLVLLQQLLVAHPSLPASTVPELVALAKAKPGAINYASYGSGSQPHLAGEMLKNKAGIDLVHVPYKGISLAVPAVMAGEVQLTFAGIATSMPQLKAGRIKALAIGGASRSPLLPQVPTFTELGLPEVETHAWFGLFLPAGSPTEAVTRIYQGREEDRRGARVPGERAHSEGLRGRRQLAGTVCQRSKERQRKPRSRGKNLGSQGGVTPGHCLRRSCAKARGLGRGRWRACRFSPRHPRQPAQLGWTD